MERRAKGATSEHGLQDLLDEKRRQGRRVVGLEIIHAFLAKGAVMLATLWWLDLMKSWIRLTNAVGHAEEDDTEAVGVEATTIGCFGGKGFCGRLAAKERSCQTYLVA